MNTRTMAKTKGNGAAILVTGRLYLELAVDQRCRHDAQAWWHHAGDGGHLAAAAARLGARVSLFTQTGATAHDDELLGTLAGEGVSVEKVIRRPTTAANSHVYVEFHGAHQPVALSSPAKCTLAADDVDAAEDLLMTHQWLLADAALPPDFLDAMAERACFYGLRTVLCAKKPMDEKMPRKAWKNIDYLVAGSGAAEALLRQFNQARAGHVDYSALCHTLPTLKGVLVVRGGHDLHVCGGGESLDMPVGARGVVEVRGVCAMAASAFTVGLAGNETLINAARFAHGAVRFYVSHEGTRAAMPFKKEMA